MIARILTTLIAIILIVYGVIAAISPLPLGVPLVVLGLIMIAGAVPAARPVIRHFRERWRWFDVIVEEIEKRSSGRFKKVFDDIEPEDHHTSEEKPDHENPKAKSAADDQIN